LGSIQLFLLKLQLECEQNKKNSSFFSSKCNQKISLWKVSVLILIVSIESFDCLTFLIGFGTSYFGHHDRIVIIDGKNVFFFYQ
jgi:hypothetical protein